MQILLDIIQAQMNNIVQYLEHEIVPRNETEVLELISSEELEGTMENLTKQIKEISKQVNIDIASKLKYIRQEMYSTDPKKAMQLFTTDQTSQCDLKHKKLKNVLGDRWKTGKPINKELAET
jgi:microcompartment protein CcmL/EutN